MIKILSKPLQDTQDKITLWLNHLLVLYTFLIPINNNAKSSMFFVMLVLFLYRRDYWKYLKDAFSNKIVQACLLFYAINAFGMLYTENIEYGMSHMDKTKYLLFPLMFLSFLDVRFAFRLITAFILGMLVAEFFSYLIHFQVLPYKFFIGPYEIYETKLSSPAPFMAHSDHSVGLSLVVGILLYQLFNKENLNFWVKAGSILFIITATLNMSFIASRTGYIFYLLIIVFVVLITYRKSIFKMLLVTLVSLTCLIFIAYNYADTVNKRVDKLINNTIKVIAEKDYSAGSVGARIGFSVYSWDVIKENLIFGVGTGDHMDEVRTIIPDKHSFLKNTNYIGKPHNVYFEILLQQGIIGFSVFIYLIITILMYKNIPKQNRDIVKITIFTMLVVMLSGMFYGTFELPLFMVFISAMIVQKQQNIEVKQMNLKLILKYAFWVALFLVIGITR